MKFICITLIIFKSALLSVHAQESSIQKFYDLFNEIEFDVLHVYSFSRVPSTYPSTSIYLFKGVKINKSLYPIFEQVIQPIDLNSENAECFATYRFYITDQLEALLIREYHDGIREHHMHYLIYDNVQKKLISSQKLSYSYGEEGASGAMESWIRDLNQDGQKDILTRKWQTVYVGADAEEFSSDSVLVSIWQGNQLKRFEIKDTSLKREIEEDFPYYRMPYLSYDAEQKLSQYLQNKQNIQPYSPKTNSWYIIAGSDEDLSSAKYELKRAQKIIGTDHKYGLDFRLFEIHHLNKRYYTVISRFDTEVEARIALTEIKKKFNQTSYVISKKRWCENLEYEGGYYVCRD